MTAQPAGTVAPGSGTIFSVRFDPGTTGLHEAVVSFGNGDADEAPYDFSIRGTGRLGGSAGAVRG